MIGLDTNVLVRYLVRDDKRQARKASAFIRHAAREGMRCFINHIVLCELVWVLESAYDFSKREITGVLEKIMMTEQFVIANKDIVRQAIKDYEMGKGDLADHLIGRINLTFECESTLTFDRALKSSAAFRILE